MFPVISVCPQGRDSHHTGPKSSFRLGLTVHPLAQRPPPLPVQGSNPDMFILLQLGPHCTVYPPPTCSNLFIMKYVRSASRQLASYWNAFLFYFCKGLGAVRRAFETSSNKMLQLLLPYKFYHFQVIVFALKS